MKKQKQKQKGFTLIELLVVISVMTFLSSIMLATFHSVNVQARDARRINNLQVMQKAIELYYQDKGEYPNPPQAIVTSPFCFDGSCDDGGDGWAYLKEALAPYLPLLPAPLDSHFYRYAII